MTLSQYDRQNIHSIMRGNGDWFTAQLLRLIAKADNHHRTLLAMGFPREVELVERWMRGEIPEAREAQA